MGQHASWSPNVRCVDAEVGALLGVGPAAATDAISDRRISLHLSGQSRQGLRIAEAGHPAPEFEDVVDIVELDGLPPAFASGLPVALEQGTALGVVDARVAVEGFGEVHE